MCDPLTEKWFLLMPQKVNSGKVDFYLLKKHVLCINVSNRCGVNSFLNPGARFVKHSSK